MVVVVQVQPVEPEPGPGKLAAGTGVPPQPPTRMHSMQTLSALLRSDRTKRGKREEIFSSCCKRERGEQEGQQNHHCMTDGAGTKRAVLEPTNGRRQ